MDILRLIFGFGWLFGLIYVGKFAKGIYDQANSMVGKVVAWLIGFAGFALVTSVINKLFDGLH